MDKKCSICGNIYKNRAFRGGFVCKDCVDDIKKIDFSQLFVGARLKKGIISPKTPSTAI